MYGIDNFWRSRKIWSCLDRILGREGVGTRKSGHFYVAVVQAIILFRLEMLEVTPCIKRILGGFHNRVERRISGNIPRRQAEGKWEYPPLRDVMREAGIK